MITSSAHCFYAATGADFVYRGLNQVSVPDGLGANAAVAAPPALPGLE